MVEEPEQERRPSIPRTVSRSPALLPSLPMHQGHPAPGKEHSCRGPQLDDNSREDSTPGEPGYNPDSPRRDPGETNPSLRRRPSSHQSPSRRQTSPSRSRQCRGAHRETPVRIVSEFAARYFLASTTAPTATSGSQFGTLTPATRNDPESSPPPLVAGAGAGAATGAGTTRNTAKAV